MNRIRVIGIDPGLVHTGIVELTFEPEHKLAWVYARAVKGGDVGSVVAPLPPVSDKTVVFIEAYRPRSHFDTDDKMVALVKAIKHAIPGSKVIDNTGVKKVITQDLMKALNVWKFSTTTHHQDLRSAAYIGLYGMVKDDELNAVLADFVRDLIDGQPWKVEIL